MSQNFDLPIYHPPLFQGEYGAQQNQQGAKEFGEGCGLAQAARHTGEE